MNAEARTTPAARTGRRPGGSSTRSLVLGAARSRFATDGYDTTTIRRIAEDAGVDPSQVMQFFGSKEQLFSAAMDVPDSALERFDAAFRAPAGQIGPHLVRAFLEAWESEPDEATPLMAMLRGAVTQDAAAARLRGFIQDRLVATAPGPEGEERTLRAGLAAAMLVGVVTSRRVIGVPALADADPERIISLLGPAIGALLEGPTTT